MDEQLSVVQWTTDTNLRLTSCVGAGAAAVNLESDEAVGKTVFEFFQVEGSGSAVVMAHRRALGGECSALDTTVGGRIYRGFVGPQRAVDGRNVGCIGFVQEGAGLVREDDELFLNLLEAAPDAMIISDGNGLILGVNALVEQLFGYSRDELLGRQIEMLVPHRVRDKHRHDRAAYRANPRLRRMGAHGLELSGLRKDGTEFRAEISLSPLKSEKGVLVFCAIRDITERMRMERSLRHKEAQLLAAQQIQECLLPQSPPQLPGFDIAGAAYPAEFAAGDHFDYLPFSDGSMGLVVGDVSGHGFSSALLMASTHGRLRVLAEMDLGLDEILARANAGLLKETEDGQFVTVILARLDPARRTLEYSNAGHQPGYVLGPSGEVKARLESTSLPLAVVPDIEYPVADKVQLAPGDLVLLLTDGALEARSRDDTPFGIDRTLDLVHKNRGRSAHEIIETLHRCVREFSANGRLLDDVTVMVVKVLGDE
jgi:PAS domain S-box-containing protein